MKHKVVLFSNNGAKIITTDDVTLYQDIPNIAIDPDLSAVKYYPPHLWQLKDNKITPNDTKTNVDTVLQVITPSNTLYYLINAGISLVVSSISILIFHYFIF